MCSLSNIIWNISNLEKLIEIDQSFLSGLTQCGLITDHSLTTLQRKFGDDPRKFAYKLLGRVDESSSDASVRLAELLVSLHNEEAARLLDPGRWRLTGSDGCVSSKIGKKKNLPEADGVPPSLVVKVIPAQQLIQGEDIYPLAGGVRRGLALVVNNETFSEPQYETRHGARRDVQNVTSLLSQMGFSVTTKENLTRAEMLQTFLDFSTNEKHGDIMVVVVMSHGHGDMKIVSSDGKLLDYYKDILRYFNNNCDVLRNKPKVFIFQACQGEEIDCGVLKTKSDASPLGSGSNSGLASPPGSPAKESLWKDMIVAFSTVCGYVSWRNTEQGSWYIETLCQVFMSQSHQRSLRRMLDMISQRMEEKESIRGGKQQATYTVIGFNKELYFNPGIGTDE